MGKIESSTTTQANEPRFSSKQNKDDLKNIFGGDPKKMYPKRNHRVKWTEESISVLKSPALGEAPGRATSHLTRGVYSDKDTAH